MHVNFLKRAQPLALLPFEAVSFWIVNLEGIHEIEIQEAKNYLSESALKKAMRYSLAELRDRSIITHAILHSKLAQHIHQEPKKIEMEYNDFGKPHISNNDLQFNLSHKKHYAFFGIHPTAPIGVDIEEVRNDPELLKVADSLLLSSEQAMLRADTKYDRFFSLWCAKEAFLKAQGTGFLARSLPTLRCSKMLENNVEAFSVGDTEVYVYNEVVAGHKLAVCV